MLDNKLIKDFSKYQLINSSTLLARYERNSFLYLPSKKPVTPLLGKKMNGCNQFPAAHLSPTTKKAMSLVSVHALCVLLVTRIRYSSPRGVLEGTVRL